MTPRPPGRPDETPARRDFLATTPRMNCSAKSFSTGRMGASSCGLGFRPTTGRIAVGVVRILHELGVQGSCDAIHKRLRAVMLRNIPGTQGERLRRVRQSRRVLQGRARGAGYSLSRALRQPAGDARVLHDADSQLQGSRITPRLVDPSTSTWAGSSKRMWRTTPSIASILDS